MGRKLNIASFVLMIFFGVSTLVLGVISINLQQENAQLKQNVNINTNNQQGDNLVAGVLNLGAVPRQATNEMLQEIERGLIERQAQGIYLWIMYDPETISLGNQIKDYLLSRNYEVKGVVNQLPNPYYGVGFNDEDPLNKNEQFNPEKYPVYIVGINPAVLAK